MSEMSRRNFLGMVGMVGGAAAAYQMMTTMGLAASSTYTKPDLSGGGQGKTVLILGAGLAGMASAYEMQKAGYDVRILEFDSKAGGRCWTLRGGDEYTELGGFQQTCDFDRGLYINPGPWRVPHHHHAYMHYAREFGVKLEPFIMENWNAYLHRKADGDKPALKLRLAEARTDMHGHVAELLTKATNQGSLDQTLSAEDKEKLLEALHEWGFLNRDGKYVQSLAVSAARGYERDPGARLEAGTPSKPVDLHTLLDRNLWSSILDGMFYEFRSTMFEPVGGMDALARAFESRVGRFIEYRSRVTEIKMDAEQVTATYVDASGATKTASGDYCICTIPLSILSQVKMTGFDAGLTEAIKKVPYAPSFKAGVQYKRRFWEQDDDIYGGISYTDLPNQLISYPSNNYFSGGKGVVLGAYMFGTDALVMSGMSPEERMKKVVEYNAQMHPAAAEEFDTGISVGWHRVPGALGCYGLYSADTREKYYPTLCARHDRLMLAGEHTSYWNGWQEGALLAATTAVDEMHKFAQGQA